MCMFKNNSYIIKPLSSSTLHTFPHETYDFGIYEDIIEKKVIPFIKIINYIFIKIIELVEKYSKRNMKVELTNTYKSITEEDEFCDLSCSSKKRITFQLMFSIGMFAHEMHIKASKVTGFKLECK